MEAIVLIPTSPTQMYASLTCLKQLDYSTLDVQERILSLPLVVDFLNVTTLPLTSASPLQG